MFIGHFAVAFAAKKAAPSVSLGTLFIAVQLLDLIWPILVLAGIEHLEIAPGITAVTPLDFTHYPFSHSLLLSGVWAFVFGGIFGFVRRDYKIAAWLMLAVFSHWLLDLVSHRPDLPLYPGGDMRVGLGLWYSLPATMIVEGSLFAVAVWLYAKTTRTKDKIGTYAFGALVAFLVIAYIGNLFGPLPPNVKTIAISALSIWLLVAWAFWIDNHRMIQ